MFCDVDDLWPSATTLGINQICAWPRLLHMEPIQFQNRSPPAFVFAVMVSKI
jgi:hypothetical protein